MKWPIVQLPVGGKQRRAARRALSLAAVLSLLGVLWPEGATVVAEFCASSLNSPAAIPASVSPE